MTIVLAILIFCILIFVHETGHLISAKAVGIRVNEFAIGMGPKLFGFLKGETQYTVRLLPIGGYCAMEGEDEDSDDPRAFTNKPYRSRALVLVSGSLMNIILTIVLLSLLIFSLGQAVPIMATVEETAPVAIDGLEPGDKVVEINGQSVNEWRDIPAILQEIAVDAKPIEMTEADISRYGDVELADVSLSLKIERNGEIKTIETFLHYDDEGTLKVGVTPEYVRSFTYFFKSFGLGAKATWEMTKTMYYFLGQLITGQSGMDQLTGPIGVVKAVSDSAKVGFSYVVQLTALISLNLGVVNLLPFPALDGGRLLFLLIRKFTGKRISDSVEGKFHFVGIMLLFALMIVITIQDVDRFII